MKFKLLYFIPLFIFFVQCEVTQPILDKYHPNGTYTLAYEKLPPLEKNRDLRLGGFSGLFYRGNRMFYTVTDRGPVLESTDQNGHANTYFLYPEFIPQIVQLELQDDHTIKIVKQIPIKNPLNKKVTGIMPENTWAQDQTVLNENISKDLWGLYPAGVYFDIESHFFWIADEYNPALLELTVEGQWVRRIRPTEGFRKAFASHTVNGGFAGIDIDKSGRLVTVLARCLEHNRNINDPNQSRPINYALRRIALYNFNTQQDLSLFYFVESSDRDQIPARFVQLGSIIAVNDTSFLVTEYASYNGIKRSLLFEAVITDSTAKVSEGLEGIEGRTFETLDSATWREKKMYPVKKNLLVDLQAAEIENPGGMALINDHQVAVINNNNYGIIDVDIRSKTFKIDKKAIKLEILDLPKTLKIEK